MANDGKRRVETGEECKECIYCACMIPKRAKLCFECDRFQTPRRFLQTGDAVLSLLVALVSVCAVGIPPLLKSLSKEESAVTVEAHAIRGTSVQVVKGTTAHGHQYFGKSRFLLCADLIISNTGTKPGFVKQCTLTLEATNGRRIAAIALELGKGPGVIVPSVSLQEVTGTASTEGGIENSPFPGSFEKYEPGASTFREDYHEIEFTRAVVTATIVEYGGARRQVDSQIDSPRLRFEIEVDRDP